MLELTNSTDQVLAAGQSAVFDTVLLQLGCTECHRKNSGSVTLNRKNSIYEVSFNCNIGATTTDDATIGITLDNAPLTETNAIVVTAAPGDLQNVSGSTYVETCCCGSGGTILLTNNGTTSINLGQYPRLTVRRII